MHSFDGETLSEDYMLASRPAGLGLEGTGHDVKPENDKERNGHRAPFQRKVRLSVVDVLKREVSCQNGHNRQGTEPEGNTLDELQA